MLPDSLFTSDTETSRIDDGMSAKHLGKLQEKEVCLFLHAVTLSDYLRSKRIPKGLRINKSPMFGLDNKEFCDRWCEILNKCSFDLMALTINECTSQLTSTKAEITLTKTHLSETNSKEEFDKILEECEKQRKQVEQEIKTLKMQKWQRDKKVYDDDAVYDWRVPPTEAEAGSLSARGRQRSKSQSSKREWRHSSYSSRGSDSSINSEQTDFSGGRKNNARRKNAGGGKGKSVTFQREPYPQRNRSKTRLF